MNYAECVSYLTDLGHEVGRAKFDLTAIRHLLGALGDPQLHYPTAIVAGTNGKGSTCAMLAEILHQAGYRTGLYTSPHLIRVNERIRVAGREIADEELASAATVVRQRVERLIARGELRARLSFFEFLTATAFLYFERQAADFAVLEVGMGGRLDATNVADPRLAVITNVDLDHQQFLGDTRAAIAAEKAGVIRPHRPVLSGCEDEEAAQVIRRRARECEAKLVDLPARARILKAHDRDGSFSFDLELDGEAFPGLFPSLAGRVQIKNATAAVAAALALDRQRMKIPRAAIREGLRATRWPGRLEVIHGRPPVLLDGAHNPAAARELARFVKEEFAHRRLRLVYASMRDKAVDEIAAALFPLAEEVYLTQTGTLRSATPDEILARAGRWPASFVIQPDPVRAVEAAFQSSAEDDVVLVSGSLFLVGAVMQASMEGRLALEPAAAPRPTSSLV